MRAVDTNLLVRLMTQDDGIQAQAAEDYIARGAWVSHLVLVEAFWVLSSRYKIPPEAQLKALHMLLDHQQLTLQDRPTVASALQRFEENQALGFSDCMILETARRAGHLPLGTFDRRFGRLDGTKQL